MTLKSALLFLAITDICKLVYCHWNARCVNFVYRWGVYPFWISNISNNKAWINPLILTTRILMYVLFK